MFPKARNRSFPVSGFSRVELGGAVLTSHERSLSDEVDVAVVADADGLRGGWHRGRVVGAGVAEDLPAIPAMVLYSKINFFSIES